jgi:hypothetical protein
MRDDRPDEMLMVSLAQEDAYELVNTHDFMVLLAMAL